ncbi:hypothetical protein EV421DRAFT_1909535 [Armillaria borealis]|uniref:Uncharacterized protein n=1 Tax=Armillaria borealis TaxID=47425 RepID=A0AA39MHP6_9AGAR|nr:hypothetical protein EV421DRAFT_1909535 [Armillaria borealis]
MQVLFRSCLSLSRFFLLRPLNSPLRFPSLRLPIQGRNYAKKAQSTSPLKPGSQQPLTKPADIAEHEKCEKTMKAPVEWLRWYCADASARAAGRVTPALLANVRVKEQKLEEVATVGIRDGTRNFLIPSITPQRQDTRTLRILVLKLTLDAKSSVASVKKGKYEKRSIELEVFQDLFDNHIADVDKILMDMKKMLGVR